MDTDPSVGMFSCCCETISASGDHLLAGHSAYDIPFQPSPGARGAPQATSTAQNQDICQNGGWSSTVVRDGVRRSKGIVPDAYVPLVMHRTHRITIMYSGLPGKSTLCAGFMHLNHVLRPNAAQTAPGAAQVFRNFF